MKKIVLFGAGAAGRYALRFLTKMGERLSIAGFVDNDVNKQGTYVDGVGVLSAEDMSAFCPDATWVACAISRPDAVEIRAQMKEMGVKTKPLWECIPVFHGLPPQKARDSISHLCGDVESMLVFNNQCIFRKNPDYDSQPPPSPKEETYFPDFIAHIDDEHFVDVGANDGDTIKMFLDRWSTFRQITAFEPDKTNMEKLVQATAHVPGVLRFNGAVGEVTAKVRFAETGDWSAHLSGDGEKEVQCYRIDDLKLNKPTYIKADIEGSELEMLWGARKKIKEHSPVLAICAYHTSDHLWQIPLLIHAINPSYKLFFRRYAEGAFEIVWYAVPPGRVK